MSLPDSETPLSYEETGEGEDVYGYRNHATFTVAMRLSNTSAEYFAQVLANVRLSLAQYLRERIESECAPVPPGTLSQLGQDMLSYALASVDWMELADEWLDNARERGVSV
jgi:hypothetical protein